MAREQVKFLMNTCFRQAGDVYEPVMITMSMTWGVLAPGTAEGSASVRQMSTKFHLPLITILPINSLAVEDITVEFDMEVHSQFEVEEEAAEGPLASPQGERSAYELAGSIQHGSAQGAWSQHDRSAHLAVNVTAGNLPLPVGVAVILDAYSKAILPTDSSQKERKDCSKS